MFTKTDHFQYPEPDESTQHSHILLPEDLFLACFPFLRNRSRLWDCHWTLNKGIAKWLAAFEEKLQE